MFNVSHLITDSGILLFLDGKQFQIAQDHPNFSLIKAKLMDRDYSDLTDLMDVRAAVRKWLGLNPRFTLTDDRLALDGEKFTDEVTDKVLRMIDAGNDPQALFNFLVKVRKNPSATAQKELLLFAVANDFMIHADGDILAYKAVRGDYKDIHSGTFDNSVGQVVQVPRHTVDDRREVTCSHGLHFAAYEYALGFGGGRGDWHLMVIKLNPADVVSIPNDYNNQKGRCSRYEVIAEIDNREPLPKKEVYNGSDFGLPDYFDDVESWDDVDGEGDGDPDNLCDCYYCQRNRYI